MLFGPKRKLNKQDNFKVTCNGHTIKSTSLVKYLCLFINTCSHLSGDNVVDNIISKVNAKLNFFTGVNGAGKSSILEAINVLAVSKSFRTSKLNNIIVSYKVFSYYLVKSVDIIIITVTIREEECCMLIMQ